MSRSFVIRRNRHEIDPRPSPGGSVANWGIPWAFLLGLAILVGCQTDRPATEIRLQLNWFPDAQFGGFFAAWLHGEYAAEGLNVTIVPGGPGVGVIPAIVSGRVHFGVGNADQVLLARHAGGPIAAVMTSLQDSPRCILVHESSGIQSLEEIRDVTLAMEEGHPFALYLKAHAALENVRIVPYSGSIARFLLEPNYAQQGYVFSEPLVARRQGSDPRVLMLSEIGFNPYTGVVIANDDLLRDQPEIVRKFVRATCRGWRRYLEAPEQTNREMQRRHPDMDLDSLREAVDVIRKLCIPAAFSAERLGEMRLQRWEQLAQQLEDLGLVKNSQELARQSCRLEFWP